MRINGLPDARDWPGLTAHGDGYDKLRRDARELHRKHNGDVAALMEDWSLRLNTVEFVNRRQMVTALAHAGLPRAAVAASRGMCGIGYDNSADILVRAEGQSLADQRETLLHEIGHARSWLLLDDIGEEAAEAWAEAWQATD